MKCPCGGRTDSVDGRYVEQGYWRRRICQVCKAESTTIEQVCVTEKGTRLRAAKMHVPKVPVVKIPRQRDPEHKPTRKGTGVVNRKKKAKEATTAMPPVAFPVPSAEWGEVVAVVPITTAKPARHRLEDMRMERELGLGEDPYA
jgi:hypothetical protein